MDDETALGGDVPVEELEELDDELDERHETPLEERGPRETSHRPRRPILDPDHERSDEESGRPLQLDR